LEALFERSVNELNDLLKLTDDELQLLRQVDVAATELVVPEFEMYIQRKFDDQIPAILMKHNLMGIPISKEYGGRGARQIVHALAMERLGQVGLGVVTFADVHQFLGSLTIQDWGNDAQKATYLPKAATGEFILAYALTEPEAGSDPASLKTSYVKDNRGYHLSGSKYLISNGSIADKVIAFAYPQGERKGMSAFIVDAHSKGFTVDMRLEEKIGLFTSDTSLISFDNLLVPKDDLLSVEGKGLAVAYSALLNGRIGVASGCVGVMEDCLNQVKERASNRVQHGKLIGKHQLVQRHISTMASSLEACRWLVYLAALKKDAYDKNREDLTLRAEADRQSAIAKYTTSRLAYDSADRAVQIFGGFGYSVLSPVAKHLLDTRVARIYEGTDEIMELKIASLVLGKDFEAYR
jgi:alkylation response protein AidB-like acyl-CoA dehydrogenase